MLARRLLIFALVLLVVTTISTALAPPRTPEQSQEPTPAPPRSTELAVVERTVDASAASPADVELQEGDRLRLTVESRESGSVELQRLGQLKAIAPGTPVVFDVLPVAGEYPVIFDGVRTVATVRVSSDE